MSNVAARRSWARDDRLSAADLLLLAAASTFGLSVGDIRAASTETVRGRVDVGVGHYRQRSWGPAD